MSFIKAPKSLFMNSLSKLLFAAILVTTFVSCTKHAERTTTPHYLSASSAGSLGTFNATGTMISTSLVGTKMSILGTLPTGVKFAVWVNSYTATPGTYTLNSVDAGADYISAVTETRSDTGILTITAVAPDLVGTFTYTPTTESAVVTGSFSVTAP
jgi:hypothetical protein